MTLIFFCFFLCLLTTAVYTAERPPSVPMRARNVACCLRLGILGVSRVKINPSRPSPPPSHNDPAQNISFPPPSRRPECFMPKHADIKIHCPAGIPRTGRFFPVRKAVCARFVRACPCVRMGVYCACVRV